MELPAGTEGSVATWNLVNRNIISFYQGWLVAALNLNLGITFVYGLGVSKKVQTWIFWVLCPLCIAVMVGINLSRRDGFVNNIAMYFSAVYALVGAAISTQRKYGEEGESKDGKVAELLEGNKVK